MNTQAQLTPVGVEVECNESTIKINVHPEQNAPVSVTCTVTNTGSFPQNEDLDSNKDGNDFSINLFIIENSISENSPYSLSERPMYSSK